MSNVDIAQTEKYKKMLGLTNLNNTTNKTIMNASTTIMGNLYISNYVILQGETTIMDINVSNNSKMGNVNISKDINLNNSIINDTTVFGNIYSNNIIIEGNIQINNDSVFDNLDIASLNVSEKSYFNNNITVNNIFAVNTELSLLCNNINIGDINSIVNIYGTGLSINTKEVNVRDKYIVLNYSNVSDIGNLAGIEISAISGVGFIRTNTGATRFEIKAPNEESVRYIATLDNLNNLNISGTTSLYGNSTINSNLVVNGDTTIIGNSIFNGSLIISGNTNFINNVTCLSNVAIGGSINVNNDVDINSDFNLNGAASVFNATILSNLDVSGNLSILGSVSMSSDLNIYGGAILQGKTTFMSNMYAAGDVIINGNLTFQSDLYINSDTNIAGNIILKNNVNISSGSLFKGSTSLLSSLYINGNVNIDGNITLGSFIGNYSDLMNNYNNYNEYEILGQLIGTFPEYKTNYDAVSNGVPLWGFYRTGGILKIRLDDTPPVLFLSGTTAISINNGSEYYDDGVYATDNINSTIDLYLYSISNELTPNIINNRYFISGANTLITETTILDIGSYNIDYVGIDSCGNEGYITRTLTVSNILKYYPYENNHIIQTKDTNGNYFTFSNNNLIDGIDSSWTFNPNYLLFDFNNEWSVILKVRAVNWNGMFQINFDPITTNWGDNNNNVNGGVSNISFQDSFKYFDDDPIYWDSGSPSLNFYENFNSGFGIYIKIYRKNDFLNIDFYDNDNILLDSKISKNQFQYTNTNSICSFYSYGNLNWLYGYLIYEENSNVTVSDFKRIFE